MSNRRVPRALTLALCGGYFLVLLDVTVVNVALPAIGTGLHASGAGLAWIVDGYATPLAALLLASGAIGDRVGHRRVVITGFLLFGAASALCAVAPTIAALTAGRAVQGIAAALMLPGTLALLTESAPDDRARTRIVAVWAAVGGAALPAGPVLGGLLVQQFGWQAVFWVNVPVIAAATIVTARTPATVRPATSRAVDWYGAVALTVLVGSVITVIIEARRAPAVAGSAALAAVLAGAVLVRVERRSRDPLIAVEPPARRPLAGACGVAGLMNLCSLGVLFVLTQVFQDIRDLPPLAAGLLVLPAMLPPPLLGPVAGRLVTRLGAWRTAAVALATAAAGFVLVAGSLTGSTAILVAGLALWGSGLGILTPAVVAAAIQATPRSPGTASGASNTARQIGGAVGVAVASAVAGTPDGGRFVHHATLLLIGAAAAFTGTAALVARIASAGGPRPGSG